MTHFPPRSEPATRANDLNQVFVEMFREVRAYLLNGGLTHEAQNAVATNPKGETTRAFDAEAERIALDIAKRRLGSFRAFSEEAGELHVGDHPDWTLVLDPCDGSNNFKRGIRCVGFAVAALPASAPLDAAMVECAVCGDIFTGTVYCAARGRGATLDGKPISASSIYNLSHAMLGVNIGHDGPTAPSHDVARRDALTQNVWNLLESVSTVRRTGSTVLDLCYVAQGAYSAYVDLRQRLTPENFLAPALIISEAGGTFTGATGQPLGAVAFTEPYSVLAAGNDELLRAIISELYRD